jgi:lipopolysaccharide export system protein LptA
MAPTDRKLRLLLAVLTGCAAFAAAAQTPAAKPATPPLQRSGEQPINLDAASSEVDYKSNTVVFKDVTVEGNVRIDAEQQGHLRSDSGVVEFQDNRILRATVIGKPAYFEQKRSDSEQIARGHADKIVYDVNEGTVRLSDDAWLTDGQSEISGPLLVYNIRAQKVQAGTTPGNDQRVHIIIQPRAGKDAGKTPAPDTSKPPPTPPPPPQS